MSQLRRFGAENKGEFTENRIALSNNGSNSSNSKNNFSSYTLPTNTLATDSSNQWFFSRTSSLHPDLYKAATLSDSANSHSHYQGLSRSIPVYKPRAETARRLLPVGQQNHPSLLSSEQFIGNNKSFDDNNSLFIVEEHHDDASSLYSAYEKGNNQRGHRSNAKNLNEIVFDPLDEFDSLFGSHSSISSKNFSYERENSTDFSQRPARTSTPIPSNNNRFVRNSNFINTCRDEQKSKQQQQQVTKPQVYRATDKREVERFTYFPTLNDRIFQQQRRHYPIVEISLPKQNNNSLRYFDTFPVISQENQLFDSGKERFLSEKEICGDQYKEYNNNSLITTTTRPIRFDSEQLNRSIYDQLPQSNLVDERDKNKLFDHRIDISSLDALLSDVSTADMSKTTKGWQSSFLTMRDKFGNAERCDETVNSYSTTNFTTNGSRTVPRGGLLKSASHGAITIGGSNDLNDRQKSLLENAVEKRAAEAPELRHSGPRHELGSFWEEIVRNHSGLPQRTPLQMTAAQRLEMLHEPVDERRHHEGRFPYHSNGSRLAERKAQFLKETLKSSGTNERILPGHLSQNSSMPNGFGISKRFETTEQRRHENGPNFSALDSAVAELGHNNIIYNKSTHSGGCQKFPTDELSTLNQPLKKYQSHSPSPDATSDTSSNYNAPTGLPHPKPKHNIREQLIQAGFEPRGSVGYANRVGNRVGSSTNFPAPSSGSVASRISEFEKRPGAPNLLQIACALSGMPQRSESPIRSPVGPMSPRSSVYRTKPVIHADLGNSPKIHTEMNGGPPSIFQFPSLKTDEIPYYDKENTTINDDATLIKKVSADLDDILLRSSSYSIQDDSHSNSITKVDDFIRNVSPLSLADRRLSRKATEQKSTSASKTVSVRPPLYPNVSHIDVPRFYFPKGKPISMIDNETALRRVSEAFNRTDGGKVSLANMPEICKAAGIPIYWKKPVFDSCARNQQETISLADFSVWWNRMTSTAHDEASRFIFSLAGPNRNYLIKEDFTSMLQDLIDSFPGLHFLREAQEFHSRYVETVVVRIFWSVNRSWTGRITANELRRSNFLQTVRKLETTDDINTVTDYFSYEHFYVIYCKFYELDKDHDLIINKIDISHHANGALPSPIIDRIFSGAVTRSSFGRRIRTAIDTITYTDFVAFLLAEEDKKHPTSIEYWFRCLDLDGDGLISLYEMEYFYNGVKSKMDQHHIDSMRFDDVVCNLLDLIQPRSPNAIALSDLKRCSLCTRFFNTFVNWVKYYEQESSEGERATVTDGDEELNDWDRYCLEEYEALMADDQEEEPEDINLNLDDDDDLTNGTNVSTTVNMTLRDFDTKRSMPILEAL